MVRYLITNVYYFKCHYTIAYTKVKERYYAIAPC